MFCKGADDGHKDNNTDIHRHESVHRMAMEEWIIEEGFPIYRYPFKFHTHIPPFILPFRSPSDTANPASNIQQVKNSLVERFHEVEMAETEEHSLKMPHFSWPDQQDYLN